MAPSSAAYTRYSAHSVQPGDTLNRVATEFGVSRDVILQTSGLADPDVIQPGQVLTIPRDTGWLCPGPIQRYARDDRRPLRADQ